MREREAVSINMPKERVIVLVKLRVALCSHASVAHDGIHAVRNVNLHLPSGNRALVNSQAVIKVVCNTCCVRSAHLTFSGEHVQDFVFCVSAETLFEVN